MFRAVTKDGHSVEGMGASESSFAIVLEDSQSDYKPIQKPDVRCFQALSAAHLEDLVAYLANLKGAH